MNLGLPVMGTTTNNPEHSYLSGNLSPRSKKKAKSSLLLSSPMSSSRKQKKKKRRREQLSSMAIEAPSLYTQDIGSEGIKTKPVQLSGPGHNNNFNVVETKDEKRRRRQRMVRERKPRRGSNRRINQNVVSVLSQTFFFHSSRRRDLELSKRSVPRNQIYCHLRCRPREAMGGPARLQ